MVNRRTFLAGSIAASAAAKAIPESGLTSVLKECDEVDVQIDKAYSGKSKLWDLARYAASVIRWNYSKCDSTLVPRYEHLVSYGDVVHTPPSVACFQHHIGCTVQIAAYDWATRPASDLTGKVHDKILGLADLLSEGSAGIVIQMANLPMVSPGMGAVSEIYSDEYISVRAIARCDPFEDGVDLSFDMIYAHVTKR